VADTKTNAAFITDAAPIEQMRTISVRHRAEA
jgi:hypothetical protein